MRGRKITTAVAGAAALLLGGSALGAQPALAAGAGETFLAGGLPLPPGAIAGGIAGYGYGGADRVAVSADGRYVAFVASADALDPDAPLDGLNLFRKDRLTGAVTLVSRADGAAGAPALTPSGLPRISDDGNRVAFVTTTGLDAGDLDGQADVYVRDVAAGRTFRATSHNANDVSEYDLSGDGAWIAFTTDARLLNVDRNGVEDVYRRDVEGGIPSLVSYRAAGDQAANAASGDPAISGNGGWVAFSSKAPDLFAGFVDNDGLNGEDLFVRDMGAATTHLVSNQYGSRTAGNNGGDDGEPSIAGAPASGATGSVFVAYSSNATNADPADGDSAASVFRRQLSDDRSRLVSRVDGVGGASADSRAHTPSISDNGQRIAFSSDAGNLGAGGGGLSEYGVYVRDLAAVRTALVSIDNDYAVQGAISGDGGVVAWFEQHNATADGDPDLPGVFARAYAPPPAALGPVGYVSRPAGDAPFLLPAVNAITARAGTRKLSADGRYAVFAAVSRRLPGGGDGTTLQVYRRDTLTGAVELVSRANGAEGAPAGGDSREATISADGTRVAFESQASLDPADGDSDEDVYVRDLAAGTTTLAGRADGHAGAAPDDRADEPAISADGRRVVFVSRAGNLGAPLGVRHVFVRDLAAGTTTVVDRADGHGGAFGNRDSHGTAISGDGRVVAWQTNATNLDPADVATDADVYVRDLAAGTTRLVSRRSGADGAKAATNTFDPAISDDGRVVAFQVSDQTLAPEAGPWGGIGQVVARDLTTHQNTLVSRAPGGPPANGYSGEPAIDGDGSTIAFSSDATNLLPGRGGPSFYAVFAREMTSGALAGPPAFGRANNVPGNGAYNPSLSADGQCLAFEAQGHNAITGAAGDLNTLYVHVVSGLCPKPLPDGPRPPERREDDRGQEDRRGAPGPGPVLSKLSLLRKRFRVGKGATAVSAAAPDATAAARRGKKKKRKPTPAGTAIRFTLNVRANVAIAIERKAKGRKVGKQCRRATRKLRKKKACVRWVKAGTLTRNGTDAGRRSVAFSGRIGRKALAPGSYRAVVKASNAAGSAKPKTLTFTVVRR
jgi:Tol biopolymer transport system component